MERDYKGIELWFHKLLGFIETKLRYIRVRRLEKKLFKED